MNLFLSLEALTDISEIDDYRAARWGEPQAERYIRALHAAFDRLISSPELGRRRADIPPSFLVYSVGSHLVIYRVESEHGRIEVLNILHPSMDVSRRLSAALRGTTH